MPQKNYATHWLNSARTSHILMSHPEIFTNVSNKHEMRVIAINRSNVTLQKLQSISTNCLHIENGLSTDCQHETSRRNFWTVFSEYQLRCSAHDEKFWFALAHLRYIRKHSWKAPHSISVQCNKLLFFFS